MLKIYFLPLLKRLLIIFDGPLELGINILRFDTENAIFEMFFHAERKIWNSYKNLKIVHFKSDF